MVRSAHPLDPRVRLLGGARVAGFDYREARNSLALIDVEYGEGCEVIASYERWSRQTTIR